MISIAQGHPGYSLSTLPPWLPAKDAILEILVRSIASPACPIAILLSVLFCRGR